MNEYNAWNPGITTDIPTHLRHQITLFNHANSTVSFSQAKDAALFCGLNTQDMCELTVERLVIHELLIRVTADLSVPDGPNYEDLGISLRDMVSKILEDYIKPEMSIIDKSFIDHMSKAQSIIYTLIKKEISQNVVTDELISFPSRVKNAFNHLINEPKSSTRNAKGTSLIPAYKSINEQGLSLSEKCHTAVSIVLSGVLKVHGRLIYDLDLLTLLTTRFFRNTFGSQKIGKLIEPIIKRAVEKKKYKVLPFQSAPIVMNTKGASAAGKSTIRPQQRLLAERMDIIWEDFAVISPDYWRKFLLDYGSLGEDYKYAAMLTGYELEMVDKKLDLYMEQKSTKGEMPHLLIDRFRFDSFTVNVEGDYQSKLLSRFGQKVLLFFVITSPAETVERAWKRGLSTLRYKAVEDLLFHNIEAYTGMPELFFSWIAIKDKDINFEFLDNEVPLDTLPRTVAFGRNGKMVIMDLTALNNIDLFKEVNIKAKKSEDVLYIQNTSNYEFLKQCVLYISEISFVDRKSKKIYGLLKDGKWVNKDPSYKPTNKEEIKCLTALGWDDYTIKPFEENQCKFSDVNTIQTLGAL